MWNLKCINNEEVVSEKVVKFKNIIGRDKIRSFFANNGMPMTDMQKEIVFSMEQGETLKYYFPNKTKYIEVERLAD